MANLISGRERKQLKRKLANLKARLKEMPRLIDCSEVFGDNFYTQEDVTEIEKQIKEIEDALSVQI